MRTLRSLLHPAAGIALAIAGMATAGRPALACLWWSIAGPGDLADVAAFRALCADGPQLCAAGVALGGCLVGLAWCLSLWLVRPAVRVVVVDRPLTSADVPPAEDATMHSPVLGSDVLLSYRDDASPPR